MGGRADHDAVQVELLSAALAPEGILDLRRLRRFVPAQWAGQAAVGLDGVVRVDLPQADAASADGSAPLPAPLQEQLAAVAPVLSGQRLSGEQSVDALEAAHRLTTLLAGVRLEATRELTARTAEKALQLKGVTSPAELSATGRERWRARSKTVTATELSALTGMGRGTAREVVAVANAPRSSAVPARQALDAGTAGWDLVAAWWRRCARMSHEPSAEVARALFSSDVPPEQAAAERLTPEGELGS